MPLINLVDHLGRPLRLGQELGAGGEGKFFEVAGAADLGAKVYHPHIQPPADKLRAMVGLQRDELTRVAAWPLATLHERPGGAVVGFLMRRIRDHKEVHTLYNPAHRKTMFPQADWKFLVLAAMNCAAALENLHECGVVMADVNQSNLLVAASARVALIDCDSFQVQVHGQTYGCEVGVDLFTPPELQGAGTFQGVLRTPNHDRFGLAVLIFQLLLLGRHPFMGRFLGRGDLPIARAIREYRYAYGRSAAHYQMQSPPHSLPLSAVSPLVADLFERAFGPNSAQPNARPSGSEWFNALKLLMQSLRSCPVDPGHVYAAHLSTCPWCELMRQNAPNFFISVAFARPLAGAARPLFVLAVVWARIEQVAPPPLAYRRPAVAAAALPTPLPAGVPAMVPPKPVPPPILTSPPKPPAIVIPAPTRQPVTIAAGPLQRTLGVTAILLGALLIPLLVLFKPAGVATLIAFAVFGVWWVVLEWTRLQETTAANREYVAEVAELQAAARRQLQEWQERLAVAQDGARKYYEEQLRPWNQAVAAAREEVARRRLARQAAARTLAAAESNWTAAASRHGNDFARKKEELRELRQRHEELARHYALERQLLQARAREMQLTQFLNQQLIDQHKIDGIGPARMAALVSFGIETALDVEERAVLEVPGFGPKLTEKLLRWKKTIEARFVFNRAQGVPLPMQQALDMKFAQERQPVEARLLAGESELRMIASKSEADFQVLYQPIGGCLQQLAQADLDLTVLPRDA